MKKIICAIMVSAVMFTLTACSENEFCNLVSFAERFNRNSDNLQIKYENIFLQDDFSYNIFFPEDGSGVLLRIDENSDGRIEQVRIVAGKYDSEGNKKEISTENATLFLSVIKRAVAAYTCFSHQQVQSVIDEFMLYDGETLKKQGELNKTQNNFHFVFYSNSLVTMFTVTNTWLKEIPETEKPESKPYFGATTNVDGESIKLK